MQRPAAAPNVRASEEDAQRAAKARRMAIGLTLIVIAFYVGFIVYTGINGAH
jgi:uncharacterized membrane protein (DUF485 family)